MNQMDCNFVLFMRSSAHKSRPWFSTETLLYWGRSYNHIIAFGSPKRPPAPYVIFGPVIILTYQKWFLNAARIGEEDCLIRTNNSSNFIIKNSPNYKISLLSLFYKKKLLFEANFKSILSLFYALELIRPF